jgi:hypothetical protein
VQQRQRTRQQRTRAQRLYRGVLLQVSSSLQLNRKPRMVAPPWKLCVGQQQIPQLRLKQLVLLGFPEFVRSSGCALTVRRGWCAFVVFRKFSARREK